jgi:3-oxoacyl-[acyl-carrier protein] reductase
MSGSLKGKCALITGASRGIGRTIVLALAARGASVAVNYKDESEAAHADSVVAQIDRAGGKACASCADVTQVPEIRALFAAAESFGGHLDIVVSNAAGDAVIRPVSATSEHEYDRVMALNARAQFFVLQEAARRVVDGGRVIVISSSSVAMPYPGTASYGGAKRAAELYALVLAAELGPRRITVNVVAPGPTDTETFRGQNPPERVKYVESATPLGRLGDPQDIADVVTFICSDAARWITRQIIQVGGGII